MQQKITFLQREADQFFKRNIDHLTNAKQDDPGILWLSGILKQLLPPLSSCPRILEIGCGNGKNIHYLGRALNAKASGLDPSQDAINDGYKRFQDLTLTVGTADQLPYEDDSFDFILFGFCLYLVDRSDLLKCLAEADRVLKSGGAIWQ